MTIHSNGRIPGLRRALTVGLIAVPAALVLAGCTSFSPTPQLTRVDTPSPTAKPSPKPTKSSSPDTNSTDYVPITSADDVLYIEVPSSWEDIEDTLSTTDDAGGTWTELEAAEDISSFESVEAPGVLLAGSQDTTLTLQQGLDEITSGVGEDCVPGNAATSFDDGVYQGLESDWTCDSGYDIVALAANDEPKTVTVLMEAVIEHGDDDTFSQLTSTYDAAFE